MLIDSRPYDTFFVVSRTVNGGLDWGESRGENNICLKYIRSVQSFLHEGDKVTLIMTEQENCHVRVWSCVVKQVGVNGV